MSDYVETDIGEFPKDWEVKKLKRCYNKSKIWRNTQKKCS
jgi:hypothetical protein